MNLLKYKYKVLFEKWIINRNVIDDYLFTNAK